MNCYVGFIISWYLLYCESIELTSYVLLRE
jgi:hypothetical protein